MSERTSTSSPAAVQDSRSASNAQGSEPSPSARSSLTPVRTLSDSIPEFPTSETFTESEDQNFSRRMAGQWSLREAFHANLRVLSVPCAELLTSVGSGLSSSEWFAKFDPATSSLRIRQQSLFSKEGEPG